MPHHSVAPSNAGHVQATWNGQVIAASDSTFMVEGNHYFPLQDIKPEFFEKTATSSFCPWKGTASYYDVVVGDSRNADAAWYYPEPLEAATAIKDYVAFWKGVEISVD